MTMGSDESLEDYEERFQLSYKRAKCTLDPESLKGGARKRGRGSQPTASTSSSNSSLKGELGNMLEDFKSEML